MQSSDAKATEAVLQAELDLGEVLQWAGRPGANTLAIQQVPKLAFMVLWIGIAVHAFFSMVSSENSSLTAAIPVLMVVFGGFFFWSILLSFLAAWQTFYGITDRRLLVLELGMRHRVTSWTPHQITSVERRDRGEGRGDVTFHQSQKPSAEGTEFISVAFVDVAEVRIVEDLVRRLAAS